ncbi:Lrp/AsnC family transcriptional regulator [Marilutibacter alkalisoli]|uniref:Lrp/AsnC family transcriptional regulator n=1 Tax=Marilutibacter alkalisoli TaxID=2591633 RepID=A0A514BQN8_9GAMM|nr:Lrp/AsnC family transcriptional regulator [Lysobacter alkalisoli]QDH69723.1 Lrp/AsnC family transcriptional regulator [Lysobacter alkalisoli]
MLDRIDFELLRLLRKNARLPNKTLAEKAGIAPSTALERVRRLHESRAIQGYHAEVAPPAIGIGLQAMVAVRLARHSRALVDSFHRHLLGLKEVLAFYHLAGADDFLVHVGVRDSHHLREFALTAFTEREEVAHIQTQLIFDFRRNTELPVYRDPD